MRATVIAAFSLSGALPIPALAGGVTGQATEWTQLANNAELVTVVGKSTEQVNNQITQISQLAEQIQNQLNIYKNMLQNTGFVASIRRLVLSGVFWFPDLYDAA